MFEISLSRVDQVEDTSEWGNDEPYVIVFAADLADTGFNPVPALKPTLYGPFDIGNVIGFPVKFGPGSGLCWGFDGRPRDIDDPDNPLILVALLESDHEDSPADFANSVRAGVGSLMLGTLTGLIATRNSGGMDLDTLRGQAVSDMRGHVDLLIRTDIERDERLGPIRRLEITAEDLVNAQNGVVKKELGFRSSEEDSHYVLEFSLGVGTGSVSSGLTSGPMDRYAAIWEKKAGPAWGARHRMTSEEYQQEFNKFTGQGYRLVHVSGYNLAGTVQFAAIWEKSEGPPWVARHNMTAAQYQEEFNKHTKAGYRLVNVSGYRGSGQDLYAAIWRKESGPAWVARHRMTSGKYQQEFNTLTSQGFRLIDISGYRLGTEERYAAIWEKKGDSPWVAKHGMTSARYQKEFNELTGDGFRLVHVTGSSVAGTYRFAAIWEKSVAAPWVARHNMTSDQYQQEFNKLASDGYRLVTVSGY
jgi:Polyglycine hydrolase-like, structural repeat